MANIAALVLTAALGTLPWLAVAKIFSCGEKYLPVVKILGYDEKYSAVVKILAMVKNQL